MPSVPRPLPDLSLDELGAWLASQGFKASHASRVVREILGASKTKQLMPSGLEERLHTAFFKRSRQPRHAAGLGR